MILNIYQLISHLTRDFSLNPILPVTSHHRRAAVQITMKNDPTKLIEGSEKFDNSELINLLKYYSQCSNVDDDALKRTQKIQIIISLIDPFAVLWVVFGSRISSGMATETMSMLEYRKNDDDSDPPNEDERWGIFVRKRKSKLWRV